MHFLIVRERLRQHMATYDLRRMAKGNNSSTLSSVRPCRRAEQACSRFALKRAGSNAQVWFVAVLSLPAFRRADNLRNSSGHVAVLYFYQLMLLPS